jgi:hypothetical protein
MAVRNIATEKQKSPEEIPGFFYFALKKSNLTGFKNLTGLRRACLIAFMSLRAKRSNLFIKHIGCNSLDCISAFILGT